MSRKAAGKGAKRGKKRQKKTRRLEDGNAYFVGLSRNKRL